MSDRTFDHLARTLVSAIAPQDLPLLPVSQQAFLNDPLVRRRTVDAVLGNGGRSSPLEFGAAEYAQLVVDAVLVLLQTAAADLLVDYTKTRLGGVRSWWLRRRIARTALPEGADVTIGYARDSIQAAEIGAFVNDLLKRNGLDPELAQQVTNHLTAALTPPPP